MVFDQIPKGLLFVKAAKVVALSITLLPITGCAIGTGLVFSAIVRAIAYAPAEEETIFNYGILGFAFIETFAFMLFAGAGIVATF